jgi:multiple sugar transport system substrate-binding protein
MKLGRRKFLKIAAGAAALPAVSRIDGATAQAYPTRPITMIQFRVAPDCALLASHIQDREGIMNIIRPALAAALIGLSAPATPALAGKKDNSIRFATVSRRGVLAMAGALALGAGGSRGLTQGAAIPASPIKLPAANGPLRWLDSGDQKSVFYKAFFKDYGAARGVTVVYDGLPWNEIATVLPLGIRNGTAPDAFNLPNTMSPAVAVSERWVQPLDDLIPNIAAWKAGFPAGAFAEGINVFGGKTYGLPYTSARLNSSLLLFGRDAMKLTEFSPGPDKPLTWDQFRIAAKQITTSSKGQKFGLILGGNQAGRWSANLIALAHRAGAACGTSGFMTGVDYRTGDIVVDSAEFVAAMELLMAIRDDGSMFPGVMSINAPQARAFIAQGAAGMILQGPWNVPIWEASAPSFDFGLAKTPAPAGKDGKTIIDALPSAANTMFINAAAKNPLFAADVFHYLGTLQGQIAWANVVGPTDPAIFPQAAEQATLSQRSKDVMRIQAEQVRVGPIVFSRTAGFVQVDKLYKEPTPNLAQTAQGLYTGQLTRVKDSLKKLKDAMNVALDKAVAAAKAEGATVARADLVYADWNPDKDYA